MGGELRDGGVLLCDDHRVVNLLTLCTLAHQFRIPRRVRYIKDMTPDTVLIINLALADLFYSSISLPFMFTTYYRLYNNKMNNTEECPWVEGDSACQLSAFLRYTNAIVEWTTLGLMALERCVTIYNYRHSRAPSSWFTSRKTAAYCCIIWLLGMTCQLPTLTGNFGTFGYNPDYVKCDFICSGIHSKWLSPRVMFFALESMVPCILILIGYIIILMQVYSSSNHILSLLRSRSTQRTIALRRSRTTRVIVELLMVYLVCVIPICVYNISLGNKVNKHKEVGIVLYCIYWLQYCINNFIYVVSNEKYRSAYCQFLSFLLCREIPRQLPPCLKTEPTSVQIYAISGSQNLQTLRESRFKTPSECEEERLQEIQSDYVSQNNSPSSTVSSFTRPGYLKELSKISLQEHKGKPPPLTRTCSISLSSSSSTEVLVRKSSQESSPNKDHRDAKNKLRRTFSW
ncbi:G-protein coupled receptor moody-like [Homarus americanus]|uniref:G-protein coupled receptor moody-like n=1 Tax=Homarus americanus TaxID=6706 RepID=UPI001C48B3D6|nr:G-protein coupled receptor moody-like [Homarus americanus]